MSYDPSKHHPLCNNFILDWEDCAMCARLRSRYPEGPIGPYTLWYRSDGGYRFEDFDTLAEALMAAPDKYVGNDWHISKPVNWQPVDTDRVEVASPTKTVTV